MPPEAESEIAVEEPVEQSESFTPPPKKSSGGVSKLLRDKRVLAVGALSVVLFIILALFLFFLGLFKLNHIEKLFVDYQFAQFDRAVAKQSSKALEEAKGKAKGTGDESVPEDAPLADQIKALDAGEALSGTEAGGVKPSQAPDGTFEGFVDDAGNPVETSDARVQADLADHLDAKTTGLQAETTGGEVASTYGITGDVPAVEVDQTGKTQDQIDAETQQKINEAVEKEARSDQADLPKDLQTEGDEINNRINNGEDPGTVVDDVGNKTAGSLSEVNVGQLLNAAAGATIFCIAYDVIHTSVEKFMALKTGNFMKLAPTFFAAADKQKEMKLSTKEVDTYNQWFEHDDPKTGAHESFTQSAAYYRATGQPQYVNSGNDLAQTDRPFETGKSQLDTSLGVASSLGVGTVCKALLNPLVQAGIATGGVVSLIAAFTNPEVSIGGLAAVFTLRTALFAGGIYGGKYLIKHALASYLGTASAVTPTHPIQTANKVDVSTDMNAQEWGRKMGGRKLSDAEVVELNQAVQHDQIALANRKGLAYNLFNLDNTHSVAFRTLYQMPSTPKSMLASVGHFFTAALDFKSILNFGQRLALSTSGGAWAATPDPYGVPHYLLTDGELDSDSILHNASVVEPAMKANPDTYKKYDKCFDDKIADVYLHSDDPKDTYGYCNNNSDQALRAYRLYRFNRRIVHNLVLLGNNQSTKSQSAAAAGPAPTTGPVNGTAQDLAKQILARPTQITFTTTEARNEIEQIAAGREVRLTCTKAARDNQATTDINPVLLGSLLAISEKYQIGLGFFVNGCHTGDSYHYTGDAVDINSVNGQTVSCSGACTTFAGDPTVYYQFLQDLSGIVPDGSGFGQSTCGVAANVHPVNKVSIFVDTCTHLHVQVPR